jgi:hypothetical protein
MSDPREIPQLTTELIDMSREYLRQETIEPAKALGKHAGLGFGGAFLFSLGALFFVFGLYALMRFVLPEGEWYEVLSRFLAFVGAAVAAAIVGWRISVVSEESGVDDDF